MRDLGPAVPVVVHVIKIFVRLAPYIEKPKASPAYTGTKPKIEINRTYENYFPPYSRLA